MDFSSIKSQIKYQFPAAYREYGPNLIAFVEAYYEWLEQETNTLGAGRNLLKNDDIDTTVDAFLENFKNKYMQGLPPSVLGNQRMLQKHILDVYRAKGSITGLKLLFRLLFNEDVEVYIPARDILKASDSVYIEEKYLEITNNDLNVSYQGKVIYGLSSRASALVESYELLHIADRSLHVLKISGIEGRFSTGELIRHDEISQENANLPAIIGSPTTLDPVTSSQGFKVGDVVYHRGSSATGIGLKAVVSSTFNAIGTINFEIVNGGKGYSTDAVVTIGQGANTSGAEAEFFVSELVDLESYSYNQNKIKEYVNVQLDAENYNMPLQANTNLNTIIGEALEFKIAQVGTISKITTTNPGYNYNGDVTVTVIDPYTSTGFQRTEDGTFLGRNAVILGRAFEGVGIVDGLTIVNSGFGYYNDTEFLYLENEDASRQITTRYKNLTNGVLEGYFKNNKGFISADKYLQDRDYYQEFSYEIVSSRPIEHYVRPVKDIIHIAGNALFGTIKRKRELDLKLSVDTVTRIS